MKLLESKPASRVTPREELPGRVNYFIGNEPERWRTRIPTYAKVAYADVYPGIDLVYYGNQLQLEYDFVVAPGANPEQIILGFEGASALDIDGSGDLVLRNDGGDVRLQKPFIYQEVDGGRREVSGSYTLRGTNTVGFQIGAYDAHRTLVIDPVLVYSTYLGGANADIAQDIAGDGVGNVYVAGSTLSTNFPTTNPTDPTHNGSDDVFVTKLDPTGAVLYSTYLGGTNSDGAIGIALDALGSAYVTGSTTSFNFPTTSGAFDTTCGCSSGATDAFVTKLDPSGASLVYSTFLGGNAYETGYAIAVDFAGSAYVTGGVAGGSCGFPTVNAYQTCQLSYYDAFLTKVNTLGSSLLYSTVLGGSNDDYAGLGIAVDNTGHAYINGVSRSMNFPTTPLAYDSACGTSPIQHSGLFDSFVTKINTTASGAASLAYSTCLGGTSSDEQGRGIFVDSAGMIHVTGNTQSSNFPTTPGAFDTSYNGGGDAYIAELNPFAGGPAQLVASTFLGGGGNDSGDEILLDTADSIHVVGETSSTNFPTASPLQGHGGLLDAFVTELNSTGTSLVFSTYLGGSGADAGTGIVLDSANNIYVSGATQSTNFPTTAGAFDTTYNGGSHDAFVAKIAAVGLPATLTLSPATATNPVDTQHCVTATVKDASGNPVPNVTVRFTVTGAVDTSGSATTDTDGAAQFCYMGPPLPGADAITAYADTDDNNMKGPTEPSGAATKTWTLPVTTPLCEITITNGGWIIAANGDRGSFGGNAKADENGNTQGQEQYQDHGPAQPLNMHSINVVAIVCDGTMEASIFGQATINGSGTFNYRIRVRDLAEPGRRHDTYGLLLQTGYDSGEQVLEGGNVQIRRQ